MEANKLNVTSSKNCCGFFRSQRFVIQVGRISTRSSSRPVKRYAVQKNTHSHLNPGVSEKTQTTQNEWVYTEPYLEGKLSHDVWTGTETVLTSPTVPWRARCCFRGNNKVRRHGRSLALRAVPPPSLSNLHVSRAADRLCQYGEMRGGRHSPASVQKNEMNSGSKVRPTSNPQPLSAAERTSYSLPFQINV